MHVEPRSIHRTFGFLPIDLKYLGQHLGNPPIPADELRELLRGLNILVRQHNLLTIARDCCGRPYVRDTERSASPTTFDCSSLVQYIFAHAGIFLPRYTHLQAHYGETVTGPIHPGDLIFTPGTHSWNHPDYPQGIGHVAIAVSPLRCIHTDNTGTQKVIEAGTRTLTWPITVVKRIVTDATASKVAVLPDNLLWMQTPGELEAAIRKRLQASHRPRSF